MMTMVEAIERLKIERQFKLEHAKEYNRKASQPRGYAGADKRRFRYLADELILDAEALAWAINVMQAAGPATP